MSINEKIVICPKCGRKNRIKPHSSRHKPVCGECRTDLEILNIAPEPNNTEQNLNSNKSGRNNRENCSTPSHNHSANTFSYLRYVKKVDVKRLIEVTNIFEEAKGIALDHNIRCNLCHQSIGSRESIRLNHGKYICEPCFENIKTIRYPETYQKKYEDYIVKKEARRIAYDEYLSNLIFPAKVKRWKTIIDILGTITFLLVVALLFYGLKFREIIGAAIVGSLIFLVYYEAQSFCKRKIEFLEQEKLRHINEWNKNNLDPKEPELKEFHDPSAILTSHDRRILEIFDYWPGYPPYWNYIRNIVLVRDNGRCQISGCPSRTEIHIHHKSPLSQGGSHRPENLVSLCVFHHGLQPEKGHERVWGSVNTNYFSMVRAHYRNGFPVRAHVRRRELADQETIGEIISYYGLACPDCNEQIKDIEFNKNELLVTCPTCGNEWSFERKLPEECGPQMAETLEVQDNPGSWNVDLGLLTTIRKPRFKNNSSKSHKSNKKGKTRKLKSCPECGKLLARKKGKYGFFMGCIGYPECNYTEDILK